jgi:hypothetical protein
MTERAAFFPAPYCTAISSTLFAEQSCNLDRKRTNACQCSGGYPPPPQPAPRARARPGIHGPIMSSAGVFVTSHGRDPVP